MTLPPRQYSRYWQIFGSETYKRTIEKALKIEDQEYHVLPPQVSTHAYLPVHAQTLLVPLPRQSTEGPILGHFLINEGWLLSRFSFNAPSLALGGIDLHVYDRTRKNTLFVLPFRFDVSVHRIGSGLLIISPFFLSSSLVRAVKTEKRPKQLGK